MVPNPGEMETKARKRVKSPGTHSEAGFQELATYLIGASSFFCLDSPENRDSRNLTSIHPFSRSMYAGIFL